MNVRKLKAVDNMYVTDTSGRKTLLKQAQAAPEGSTNVRQSLTIPGRALAVRLKGAADQVQSFLASQPGGEMPVARLEALVKADGVGLSGAWASKHLPETTFALQDPLQGARRHGEDSRGVTGAESRDTRRTASETGQTARSVSKT